MEVPLWNIVYLNPPKIDSHKYCVSTYIIILVFHVILQDKMITWSCDFLSRSHSRLVIILPYFVAINIVVVEIQCF